MSDCCVHITCDCVVFVWCLPCMVVAMCSVFFPSSSSSSSSYMNKTVMANMTASLRSDVDCQKPDNYLTATYLLLSSLCGASTVAIDNKIEQAMDLVKSHLMFAVREEVEVLKEHIKELIEKNAQLETENNILKASAAPETLAQIQNKTNKPSQMPPTTSS